MHSHALLFIQDLALIMLVAGVITVLCNRFKQPIVFGYIVAGIIIGPHTPPFSFISDQETIKTLAELGVIFLMFSLGLEFNFFKLSKVGASAFVAAFLEIVLMIWLGYTIGQFFKWTFVDSIFLGAILAISSTTIIVKALDELGLKKEKFSQLIFGILIIEDIFAILILAFLSSLAITGSLQIKEVLLTATQLVSFLVISLLLGILLIPKLIAYIARFKNNEVLLISVLGLCFGFCLLVVKFKYNVALGAFIIGAIIAESAHVSTIEKLINPIRDMFSAIFFVSVGLLFDPTVIIRYSTPIIIITLAVIIGKVLTCSLGVLLTGQRGKTAMRVGMGLAQIGEFSFIIASLGITLEVTGGFLYSIAVAVSVITTITTPYLIKYSDTFSKNATAILPKQITHFFTLYASWIQHIKPHKHQIKHYKKIKTAIIHSMISLFITMALFLSAAYLAKTKLGHDLLIITNAQIQKTIIWCIALILSLPFLTTIYRKMNNLSAMLTELHVNEAMDKRLTQSVIHIIASIIPIITMIAIMFFISVLSASILPPLQLLVLILIITAVLIMLLKPWLTRLYMLLQISLRDSLKNHEK